jgi:exodeoxyribonuclease V gamma subunit
MTFLETLVAARSHLIVTWTGQRATDSRALDAAGPVAELMEVVRLSLTSPSTNPPDTLAAPILTRHPLQPFTPSNFLASHPLSFDLRYLSGARRITADRMPLPVHWPAEASRPTELPTRTTLDDLTLAIAKPADWFCQRRLNVRLGRFETVLHEREPIALDALERWQLRDRVLAWEVANVPVADRERALIASGDLPIGAAEKLALSDIEDAVKLIVDRVRSLVTDPPTSVPIALTLDGLDLIGVIDHVHHIDRPGSTAVRVLYTAGRLKDPDVIALWVEHLVLTTVLRRPVMSHLVAHDGHVSFAAEGLSVARDLLRSLISAWLRGHLAPLPFFARTARAYYDWLDGAPLDAEIPSTVRDAWHKKRARFDGECDAQDASIQLLFGDRLDDASFPFTNPLFLELTHTIVAPLHGRFKLLPLA